jgi:uncharacterized protein
MSGWAEIINNNTQHRILNEATGGSIANLALMRNKDLDMGVTAAVIAGDYLDEVRSMFAMHDGILDGVALARSGIRNLRDLEGKYVSPGSAGGIPALINPRVMDAFDVDVNWVYLGMSDSISALADGQIDACLMFGGMPRPAFEELDATHKAVRVGPSKEEAETIAAMYPEFETIVIPKETYGYLEEDEYAVRFRYTYAIHKDIPEQVVYELVKTTIEHWKDLRAVHASLQPVLNAPEDLAKVAGIYMHPGAIRAYREAGIPIPDGAVPPEMN